ncbi:hypothetical protein AB0Q95_26465 [Streptomyces sp. NPDC059900]|uniref:hypothetical protein n=1 Tax=Streptomyces sp. NPDC059900 TaxID=3155816 RepID=UPI0034417AD8
MPQNNDPLAARTPGELLDSCRASAEQVAGRVAQWDSADPAVRSAVDAGAHRLDGATPADLRALADWRPSAVRNSVYMDATTVGIAERLLAGDRRWLTPLSLWDLAAFADRVVMSERIYYAGEDLVPAARLNQLLGEDVFVSLPHLSRARDSAAARLYEQSLDTYRTLISPLVHQYEMPGGTYWADAVREVAAAWTLVTGRPVRPGEALAACEAQGWFTPKLTLLRDPYCDDLPSLADGYCAPVLGDVTYRAHASQSFANLLGLPYAPATARMPFRHYFCERGWDLEDQLLTADAASRAYRELAGEQDLVLPVFLAVALSEARRIEDVWPRLAELRTRARRFRRHRQDLDEALSLGEASETSRQLLMAVRSEAVGLTEVCGHGFSLVAKIVGRLTRATPAQLPEEIATLMGIASAEVPADLRRRLWWQCFRPELRFLIQVRSQSREMTDAMPKIGRLWGLPQGRAKGFRERFEQLGRLRTVS